MFYYEIIRMLAAIIFSEHYKVLFRLKLNLNFGSLIKIIKLTAILKLKLVKENKTSKEVCQCG